MPINKKEKQPKLDFFDPHNINAKELYIWFLDRFFSLTEVEKSLKVLKIIKEKRVNVEWLLETENVEEYNESLYNNLTQEEYDLLKEVLK